MRRTGYWGNAEIFDKDWDREGYINCKTALLRKIPHF
jgi:hypothetical protein